MKKKYPKVHCQLGCFIKPVVGTGLTCLSAHHEAEDKLIAKCEEMEMALELCYQTTNEVLAGEIDVPKIRKANRAARKHVR
jgi:hypothetical protein